MRGSQIRKATLHAFFNHVTWRHSEQPTGEFL